MKWPRKHFAISIRHQRLTGHIETNLGWEWMREWRVLSKKHAKIYSWSEKKGRWREKEREATFLSSVSSRFIFVLLISQTWLSRNPGETKARIQRLKISLFGNQFQQSQFSNFLWKWKTLVVLVLAEENGADLSSLRGTIDLHPAEPLISLVPITRNTYCFQG